jgi:GH24 family phage-related lysozyme (muramidase)
MLSTLPMRILRHLARLMFSVACPNCGARIGWFEDHACGDWYCRGSDRMNLSPVGLALLKSSEGFRASVYSDAAGLPTIGYGHKLQPAESFPKGITEAQAGAILAQDLLMAMDAVDRLVKVPLTQGQFDALVDFTFNLGEGRLAKSTLLADLNAGAYDSAAQQLLLWDHAGAVELPALKARREAEYNLWTGATS